MAREKVLVVEDDEDISELIAYNLGREGYVVTCARSVEEAAKRLEHALPHAVLLDLMLPGMDGLEWCRRLKAEPRFRHLPILIVSAKGEEADVVAGLELGAVDYITKPFRPRELVARLRSVLRRQGDAPTPTATEPVVRGDLIIDPGRREVRIRNRPVEMTFSEFQILDLLARRPGWVFTRYQIVDAVHGENYPVTDRSVDVQIAGLRRKLGKLADRVETVRGVGYRFRDDPSADGKASG